MTKAVEAGGQNNFSRNLRNYADSVVLHASNAVAGGAKIIHERIVDRNMRSFRHTVKRLEELSVSCRGIERVQMLRRWLVALKEVERLTAPTTFDIDPKEPEDQPLLDDFKDSPHKPTLVYYVDHDVAGEPKSFRDVFLHSQALEGITLSLILEAPNEEEISLLSEIYGLCIKGGKEECTAVISSVQDLAIAFSGYQDEVLTKREELLQYVQAAISGLKVNADLVRIEDEACSLKERIEKMNITNSDGNFVNSPKKSSAVEKESLDEALAQIKMCSKLEELLLKKKYLSYGDSPELHAEKVDKLKILSESLANSTAKAESRISENRSQKEEALHFRVTKSNEVNQIEKELTVEIEELVKQKDELEDRLKMVNTLLASAQMRLRHAKEEREQFDEASNEIIAHLKTKEDELVRAITSYTMEGSIVGTWIHFLESTWVLQTSHTKKKEEQVNMVVPKKPDSLENRKSVREYQFAEKLSLSVIQIRKLVENISSSQRLGISEASNIVNPRNTFEEEYLDIESKFLTTLNIVDTLNKQFHIRKEGIFRKDSDKVIELLDAIEKIKDEFESIERPKLAMGTANQSSETPSNQTPLRSPSSTSMANKQKPDGVINSPSITGKMISVAAESSQIEAELDKYSDYDSAEEISEWEFDAVERDHQGRS
ncbi:unnamed protein product [Lupinus luteus]|uniref:Uncharacterized protein n=1 Tax=Lupinus luteus TaxID=3873 RepID=A0AAV1VRN3_LUPLU